MSSAAYEGGRQPSGEEDASWIDDRDRGGSAMTEATAARPVDVCEPGLVPRLLSIAKTVRQLVRIRLAEVGINSGQDQFLISFERLAPRPVNEIARTLSVQAPTVSKMADILSHRGWVVRKPDLRDARRVLLQLTADGLKAASAVRKVYATLKIDFATALGLDRQAVETLAHLESILD